MATYSLYITVTKWTVFNFVIVIVTNECVIGEIYNSCLNPNFDNELQSFYESVLLSLFYNRTHETWVWNVMRIFSVSLLGLSLWISYNKTGFTRLEAILKGIKAKQPVENFQTKSDSYFFFINTYPVFIIMFLLC